MEDGFFWILMTAVGLVVLGGTLAMALVRDNGPSDEERAESERATRRLYGEEASDAAR